jgi:hypothetical protein
MNNAFFADASLESAIFNADTIYNQWTIFPPGFDPLKSGLTFVRSLPGDFDGTDGLAISDVDLLSRRIRDESFMEWQEMFDLNADSAVDREDLRIWVVDLKKTWFGDADLNGEFNSGDLVSIFQAGHYEDQVFGNSAWGTGDWNADGEFTTSDLVFAFQDGGYEQGPRVGVATVPEPTSGTLAALGGLLAAAGGKCRFRVCSLRRRSVRRSASWGAVVAVLSLNVVFLGETNHAASIALNFTGTNLSVPGAAFVPDTMGAVGWPDKTRAKTANCGCVFGENLLRYFVRNFYRKFPSSEGAQQCLYLGSTIGRLASPVCPRWLRCCSKGGNVGRLAA